MALDYISVTITNALLNEPALSQAVTYQRPASAHLSAVAPFSLKCLIETGMAYASPTGPIYGNVQVRIADIPLSPHKGDQIVVTDSTIKNGTYLVQEVFPDENGGYADLKLRWTGQ